MDNDNFTISSWSGGKDSILACYKAIKAGENVKYLLNFVSKEYRRTCFHGIEADLLRLQTELSGIPLVQKEVSSDLNKYETEFKQAVVALKNKGAKKMVFGDIYLDEHKQWVTRVCSELNIEAIEPLWKKTPEDVVDEFIKAGFKAIVVSCNSKFLDKDFIGRPINKELISYLKKRGICPCGENGEFHTFVLSGPLFKTEIEITKSRIVSKKGYGKYWFLDIQEYKSQKKEKRQ
ncbi:MAG: diphthine--ammonia ligase [Candidatus Omnitrophica bacterium]|nr:diphthine--ammonia ligase [Candidatus Omnitrophota bacterium]